MSTESENINRLHDVDIVEIFRIMYLNKILIISITTLFAVSSVIYSLSLPNIYKSSALLYPSETNDSAMNQLNQRYGSLASLAGVSLPSSASDSKVHLAINKLYSREFLEHLMAFESITEKLYATKAYSISTKEIIYDPQLYDVNKKLWVRQVSQPLSSKPSVLEVHELYLSEILQISHDRLTNFVTISISHKSPIFAKEFLELVITELNEISRNESINQSNQALDYLNAKYSSALDINMKDSVTRLIESQIQIQMFASIQDEFLLKMIDNPYIPEKKNTPSRSVICILGTILGFIVSIIVLLIRKLLEKGKY